MASIALHDPTGRWTQAVLKLTKLTREGRITWTKAVPAPKPGMETDIEVFQAQYDNQRLRLRRFLPVLTVLMGLQKGYGFSLEIIDERGEPIWTFPAVDALADLYQAVQYYQAGVGNFIDRLLAQP